MSGPRPRPAGHLVWKLLRWIGCDFIVPSVLRRGPLQIAVSTSGRSPALAREIRRRLEALFDPGFGQVVEEAGRSRARIRATEATSDLRATAGERIASLALAGLG